VNDSGNVTCLIDQDRKSVGPCAGTFKCPLADSVIGIFCMYILSRIGLPCKEKVLMGMMHQIYSLRMSPRKELEEGSA
jgi:hypothetical protein